MQKSIYVLGIALFTLALSSCSRGYGCDYGDTELKPLDQPEQTELVANETNEESTLFQNEIAFTD